jgi:ubiquinone/menaquinone biosynthesis C-methylase UbiE
MVIADSLTMPFSTSTFDVVTMWDVLEHLRDPHSAVAEVARVLRPGGRFVLTTGDVRSAVACLSRARWHLYTIPEHLFFYSRKSLRLLLSAHGFSVTRLQAEGAIYSLGYLVERLRKSLLGREESKVGRWPGWQLRIPVNLFDIVTVEATRQFE